MIEYCTVDVGAPPCARARACDAIEQQPTAAQSRGMARLCDSALCCTCAKKAARRLVDLSSEQSAAHPLRLWPALPPGARF
jgi:hypothetical protein